MLGLIGRLVLYTSVALVGVTSFADDTRRIIVRTNATEFLTTYAPQYDFAPYYDTAYSTLCMMLIMTPLALLNSFSFVGNLSGIALLAINFALNFDPKQPISEMFVLINALGVLLLTSCHKKCTRGKARCTAGKSTVVKQEVSASK